MAARRRSRQRIWDALQLVPYHKASFSALRALPGLKGMQRQTAAQRSVDQRAGDVCVRARLRVED